MKRSTDPSSLKKTLMQVLYKQPCKPTTLTFPPLRNFGHFFTALRQNGLIPFVVLPAFGLAQNPGLVLVDLHTARS